MKKIKNLLYCASVIVLTAGCGNYDDDSVIATEETSVATEKISLNLVSPNRIRIAENIDSLKKNTSEFFSAVNDDFPGIGLETTGFEITNIEYVGVSEGFDAVVEYRDSKGKIGEYQLFYDVKTGTCMSIAIPDGIKKLDFSDFPNRKIIF